MGFFLSFSQAAAVPDRSSRGCEWVTERWWPSGTRGRGSREKDASISPRLGPLALFPEEFVFTPLNKNWLVLVPPGKKRQIQEYLCLQRIYGDLALSPQTPGDSWYLISSLGYSPASVPSSPGNFIPIPHLQIPWGSQCPSFLGYEDLPTSNPGNRVSHSLDLLFLFYKD